MGYVAASFVLVIGLFGLASSFMLFWRAQRSRSFIPVPGRIVERSVVDVLSGSGPAKFGLKVKYVYRVDGRDFVNDRLAYFERGYDLRTAQRELAKLPNEVTVYANPRDPADAVVDRRGSGLAIVVSGIGMICVLIATLIFAMQ